VHQRGAGRLPVAGQGRQGHRAAGSCGAIPSSKRNATGRREAWGATHRQHSSRLAASRSEASRLLSRPRIHAPRQECHPGGAGLARRPCDPAARTASPQPGIYRLAGIAGSMWRRSPTDGRDSSRCPLSHWMLFAETVCQCSTRTLPPFVTRVSRPCADEGRQRGMGAAPGPSVIADI
jgi:hypothetical protein